VFVAPAAPAGDVGAPGLLFFKTPAVVPVAVGRYLYGNGWIPMRHDPSPPGSYEPFSDPGLRRG
jgi:hypothetical protein